MLKQKVVMKLGSQDAKKKSKALQIAVGVPGVLSASLEGENRDKIVVVGDGLDAIQLATMLRKKVGHVDLISLTPVPDQKIKEGILLKKSTIDVDGDKTLQQPVAWPSQSAVVPSTENIVQPPPVVLPNYQTVSAVPAPAQYEFHDTSNESACRIM